jgi:pimeloyl-ACP methyl ester carboxylesterase
VVLVGASMGAIAVLRCAAEHPDLAGVVMLSAPARWVLPRTPKAIAAALLTRTPPGRALAARALRVRVAPRWTDPAPPVDVIRRLRVPVAILHGARDTFIPAGAAEDLYRLAPEPKRLDVVTAAGHAYSEQTLRPIADAVDWAMATGASSR